MIAKLDEQIEQMMQPFCAQRELIASVPGSAVGASAAVISEIGADPAAWFPTAEHLASWVGLCPGNHESAGKRHHGARRKGNQHLQPVLVECAWAAVRTDGYLREFSRRQVRKFGGFCSPAAKKKAIIAVAHTLIVIIWHVLATGQPYQDLGTDYFTTRINPDKERRRLVAKLEAQGFKVTPNPPPNTPNTHCRKLTRLRCAQPGGYACPGHLDSRTSLLAHTQNQRHSSDPMNRAAVEKQN
jgi:transposase